MKIIDLFNKIANGEDVPKKIEYCNKIWIFDKKENDYVEDNRRLFNYYLSESIISSLNDEVKIIEDNKIENIDIFDYFTGYDFNGTSKDLLKHLEHNFEEINSKFNELIDEVNKLKEGK